MENKEIKRTRPEAHDCNLCKRLSNIKEIARGGSSIIYKASLIDGLIDEHSIKHYDSIEFERKRTNKWEQKIDEVAIKIIKMNSSEVYKEDSIWGITQNAETLEYGIVMEFAKHGDM
ncbi:hypothetical protein G9A89_009632 [Geosiphon pyriformis]|nr:hypothetical protein G9A89_009632 [Geosiphon pyriformis]